MTPPLPDATAPPLPKAKIRNAPRLKQILTFSDVTLVKTLKRNVSPARQIPLPNLRDVTLIVCTPEKWDVVNSKP